MQRRYFLINTGYLISALTLPLSISVVASAVEPQSLQRNLFPLSAPEERLLAVVLDTLYPSSTQTPGASDVNAKAYILRHFRHPGTPEDEREFLRNGLHGLNDLAHDEYVSPFESLSVEKREIVLKIYSTFERGENWLSTLLSYIFEACFGDPVYGGNPNGIGWRWIAHRPGFPRPPVDKLYGPA